MKPILTPGPTPPCHHFDHSSNDSCRPLGKITSYLGCAINLFRCDGSGVALLAENMGVIQYQCEVRDINILGDIASLGLLENPQANP